MSVRSVDDAPQETPALPPTLFRLRDLASPSPDAKSTPAAPANDQSGVGSTATHATLAGTAHAFAGTQDAIAGQGKAGSIPASSTQLGSGNAGTAVAEIPDNPVPAGREFADTADTPDPFADFPIESDTPPPSENDPPVSRSDPPQRDAEPTGSLRQRLAQTTSPRGWMETLASNRAIGFMLIAVVAAAYWTGRPGRNSSPADSAEGLVDMDETIWLSPEEVDALPDAGSLVESQGRLGAPMERGPESRPFVEGLQHPDRGNIRPASAPGTGEAAGNIDPNSSDPQASMSPVDFGQVFATRQNPSNQNPAGQPLQGPPQDDSFGTSSAMRNSTETRRDITPSLQNMMRQDNQGLDDPSPEASSSPFRQSSTPNGVDNWLKFYPETP